MKEEEFDWSIGEEPENDELDFMFEDELDDDDLDEQPKEGTPLYTVMKSNGILTPEDRKKYHKYDTDNLGCRIEKPILIEETEDYVNLEYEILAELGNCGNLLHRERLLH